MGPERKAATFRNATLSDILGDDLVARCLAFLPVREHGRAKSVCRKWMEVMDSSYILDERKRLKTMESWLCAAGGALTNLNGDLSENTLLDTVEVFDPLDCDGKGRWHSLGQMPTKRYGFACVGNKGKLYTCGGWSEEKHIVRTCASYDPTTGTWDSIADMPEERSTQACGVVGDSIIVAGGTLLQGGQVDPVCSDTTVVYNTNTATWGRAAKMAGVRDDCGAAMLGDKLYVAGGISGFESRCFNSVECYDPGKDIWVAAPPMEEVREGCAAGVVEGRMYVCGGARENSYWHGTADAADCLKSVEAYDPRAGRWSRTAPMLNAKFGCSATNLGGKLYVFGGAQGVDFERHILRTAGGDAAAWPPVEECLDVVEMYDPRADRWIALKSMMSPRNFCGVGVVSV